MRAHLRSIWPTRRRSPNCSRTCNDTFGSIDILVLNGGGPKPGTFTKMTLEDWDAGYRSVLRSMLELTSGVLPAMAANAWGRIVALTSSSVKQPIPNLTLSNAFRTALVAALKTLSIEVARDGITVNSIATGRVRYRSLAPTLSRRSSDARGSEDRHSDRACRNTARVRTDGRVFVQRGGALRDGTDDRHRWRNDQVTLLDRNRSRWNSFVSPICAAVPPGSVACVFGRALRGGALQRRR